MDKKDENVVFDPAQQGQQPATEQPAGEQPVSEQPVGEQPTTDVAQTESPTGEEVAGEEVAGEEVAGEELEQSAEDSEPPPPAGFLGNGLWKKVLIGVGILIVLIIVIIMLIPKESGTKQVTLTWWGLWEDRPAIQTLILDFKKTHPNIDVVYEKRSHLDYRDKLVTRTQSSKGPDVFRYHNTWVPMLSEILLPLSADVISPEEFKKVYYPVMQQDLVRNGAIYGIPMMADSLALYVNPELFEAAGVQVPRNWFEYRDVVQKLTVKDAAGKIKTSGGALGTYDNVTHAPDIISLLFVQQGVDMNKFLSTTKQQSEALKFYTAFATDEKTKVWDASLDKSILLFSRGELAMYFGFSWDVFAIQRLNKDLEFKIYPVPELNGKKTTIASYWVEGVSSKSPNQKEALEFMHFLAQKETAEKFYTETSKTRAFGEPYARSDLRESLREYPLVYPFVSQLDDAASSFFASDTHDGETGLNSSLNTYLGTSVRSMTEDADSADSAAENLNKGVFQVFEKYGIQQLQ